MTANTLEQRVQRGGVSRVLTKLDNSIEAGNYYEAHQMYRTLYFRYVSQRKFEECLNLLYDGAMKLAAKQQETSAADLGLLLLDTLEKRGSNEHWELWAENLMTLIGRLSPTTIERETLINRCIKWSGDICGSSIGHPTVHKLVAFVLMSEGNIEQARHHYLLCRDGQLCGRILIKINRAKGYASEIDLFIVQAALQQLCLKERKSAEETFSFYTSNHPQINRKEAPFKLPLLNFTYYLFRIISKNRLDSFQSLCNLYKPSLNRDPSFEKYLAKIGVIYFGAVPPQSSSSGGLMGGMVGDLFARLFQGFEDDEDDQSTTNSRHNLTGANNSELD